MNKKAQREAKKLLQEIVDHFTDQAAVEFQGFTADGKGKTKEVAPSPPSFAHDSDWHEEHDNHDPMMRFCPSCFVITACRRIEVLIESGND